MIPVNTDLITTWQGLRVGLRDIIAEIKHSSFNVSGAYIIFIGREELLTVSSDVYAVY